MKPILLAVMSQKKALTEMDQEHISCYLLQNGTDWCIWHKNPPGNSYMGEVWDHQICCARNILNALLKTHGSTLDDESLRTLIAEAESINNSGTLMVGTLTDINSVILLSPCNLLITTSDVMLP